MDVEVMIESRQMRIDKPIMHTVVYECATKQNDIKRAPAWCCNRKPDALCRVGTKLSGQQKGSFSKHKN